jgi:glycosyltransferase involved in cell wall biosynthesis
MVAYREAGIGQYCLNLLRELAELQAGRNNFEVVVYHSRKERRPPAEWLDLAAGRSFKLRALWTPPHNRFEQLALPLEIAPLGPDVFHSPDFIPPLRRLAWRRARPHSYASVITIHDLAFRRFPDLLTAESARYYGQIEAAVASADRIIAVSNSTAQDIAAQLKVSYAKIRVVYEAANPLYRPLGPADLARLGETTAQAVSARLAASGIGPTDQFLLFVSTIEPRKNLPVLLKAFRRMLDVTGDGQENPRLVLAGRPGWLHEEIYRQAGELGLEPHLVWLGGVSSEELLYLYNRAALLAMPSLYEGFGLPPLESLACGCPVLVADTSSLPEVVGPVGKKIPPDDVEAWSAALQAYWENRSSHKARAREEGPAWAARFSWKRAAEETLQVYFEAAKLKNFEF